MLESNVYELTTQPLTEQAAAAQKDYKSPLVAALINNTVTDLQKPVSEFPEQASLKFIELDSEMGWHIYRRSVLFLLITAAHELSPEAEVVAQFTANKGLFIEISLPHDAPLTADAVRNLEKHMREIIAENRPVKRRTMSREDAVRLFKESRQIEKANLISAMKQPEVSIYKCGDYADYLYGAMIGSTGSLGRFALDFEAPGVLLRTPEAGTKGEITPYLPQPKLSHILAEAKEWAGILHCRYVTDLNRINRNGQIGDLIRVSEALQEKRIAQIADHIAAHRDRLRLVLIAGPSSSGKTSFAQRLKVQMRVAGLEPVSISLDDYFVNRAETPRNERGEYDYECLEALQVDLFNQNMVDLLAGREVRLPRYNFITGNSEWQDVPMALPKGQPIIIEGIHGLNEKLSAAVPRENKFKIYISALTQLNIDAHNRIPTTDARLLRRLVRDYQFRGAYALKTLKQWPDVRAGEEKNIFPYQEEADVMFNSALIYELGVLKKYAKPLLEMIPPEEPVHAKAQRLLDFCQYFDDITAEDEIPNNSLLREFIGKSVFFK